MGTYKNGICGPFSGKIGTVVGSTWNGIEYMRSLPRRSKRKPTEAQKAQRMKLAMAIAFLRPLSGLVNKGFKSIAIKKTGFNAATSQLISGSVSGIYPDFAIDYSKVLISIGNLTGAWNAAVSSATAGLLTVSWENNSASGTAKATDKAVLVVYNPSRTEVLYTSEGSSRDLGMQSFSFPANYSGQTVHVWISFISQNQVMSTSIYAGNAELH